MRLTVAEIAAATGGQILRGDPGTAVTGISTDTRSLRVGDAFFALVGERDGHAFVSDAAGQGASALIVAGNAKSGTGEAAVIKVADTLLALGDLAAKYRRRFDVRIAGVTGSVGKTTTKEMLAAILNGSGTVLKNAGNFNNEIGLPLTIFELEPKHRYAVLEMAMRGPGEIDRLAEIAGPEVGIITNIGISHIERLGSVENIARAKGELLRRLPESGAAVLDAECEWFGFLSKMAPCRVVTFGFSEKAEVRASNLTMDDAGCPSFDISADGQKARVRLSAPGEHNARNALAAVAASLRFDVPITRAADALRSCELPEMRMNVSNTADGITVVDDTYNASPASMAAALRLMRTLRGNRKVAVLGDMLELGDQSESAHREVGELAVEYGAELLVTVGERAKLIAEGARSAGLGADQVKSFAQSDEVVESLKPMLTRGDVVLLKGSRAMKMERIVEGLLGK